jgi:hypothetical protein
MNINIQVSGQDMSASSGAFEPMGSGGKAPIAAAAVSDKAAEVGDAAPESSSKKPSSKKSSSKKSSAKKSSAKKPTAKKGGKSKFTLEGSPITGDSRFEWALIAFLLVAILLVL